MIANNVSDQFVDFTGYLKQNGFSIGIDQTRDALTLLGRQTRPDQQFTKQTLRGLFCSNLSQWQQFDDLFQQFWFSSNLDNDEKPHERNQAITRKQNSQSSGIAGTSTDHFSDMSTDTSGSACGAGKQRTIGKADFRFLNDTRAMREIERLTERLALSLKQQKSRRKTYSNQGEQIDIRQTLRRNMKYGGALITPRFRQQLTRPFELVILHDVSHSMTWNNPLLFRFVRGLVRTLPKTEAFVFHTQLHQVTTLYRERSVKTMQQKLEAKNNLWLGGTCIGESLHEFNQRYAKKYLNSKTVLLIISDGFDTDAPEYLATQLKIMHRQCRRLLWLNPMLGREHYQADSETFNQARPYIDSLVPANTLDSLRSVIQSIRQ